MALRSLVHVGKLAPLATAVLLACGLIASNGALPGLQAAPLAQTPSCPLLDNFNRANGAPGANWGGATSTFQIASNQLSVLTSYAGPLLWSPTNFGATQQACVKFADIDPNSSEVALVLKAQSNAGLGNGLIEVAYDPTFSPGQIQV